MTAVCFHMLCWFILWLPLFAGFPCVSFGYPYLQVSLASDFMYNHMSRDVTSSFGYDYLLRQVSVFRRFTF
jgi:hypothetical protein